MTKYIRVDDDKDFDWLRTVITNLLSKDPNNQTLQVNYPHIAAWDKYLTNNIVSVKEVMDIVEPEVLPAILDKKHVEKLEAKKKPPVKDTPKRKGRPPSKKSLAMQKAKARIEKKKELESDPFRCPEHPTYGGKNRLSRECDKCWDIYKAFHPAEWKQARAAFERSQRKA